MYRLTLLFLGLTLLSCAAAPLVISIRDYSADMAQAGNSVILFQKAQQDQTPPVAARAIQIEGDLTFRQQDVTLEFYASDGPPCATQVGGVYACAAAGFERVGEVSFGGGARQRFGWEGSQLTAGTNKGTLYLGVRLKSGLLTTGTLLFENLRARVVLL